MGLGQPQPFLKQADEPNALSSVVLNTQQQRFFTKSSSSFNDLESAGVSFQCTTFSQRSILSLILVQYDLLVPRASATTVLSSGTD